MTLNDYLDTIDTAQYARNAVLDHPKGCEPLDIERLRAVLGKCELETQTPEDIMRNQLARLCNASVAAKEAE
jgi:hypothetical protein